MIEQRSTLASSNGLATRPRSSRWLRALSLGLAMGLLAFFALHPGHVLTDRILITQAVMPIALLGISGGLIYALGMHPRSGLITTLVSPWATWPLMMASLAFLALNDGAA